MLFYSSYSMYLNEEALKMPFQPPVEVKACTKVTREDILSDCIAFGGAYER